jgi:hypothetical protein
MYFIINKTSRKVETHKGGWPSERIAHLLFHRCEITVISTGSNTIKFPELKEEYITELNNGTSIEDAKEMYMASIGENYLKDEVTSEGCIEIPSQRSFPFIFPDYGYSDKDRHVTIEEYFNR